MLAVLYLAFNEGYLATSGPSPARRDLADDAYWLSTLLMRLLPNEPEVIGLVALMQLHLARATVRFDRAGGLILLKDQDRGRWDQNAIRDASTMVEHASWLRRPGPYQLQAAIAACHAEAPSWEATDWAQILLLYNSLLVFWPTPVVRLNRAIALRHVVGPEAALAELQDLADELKDYHLYHSTRAQLRRELGRESEVPAALNRALELTENPAERALLRQRIG